MSQSFWNNILKQTFCVLFLLISVVGFTQKTSDKLKRQQKDIQRKISNTRSLLEKTKDSKQNVFNELALIDNQIDYREELISNINVQVERLNDDIKQTQKDILMLENSLEELKMEYAQMVKYAYKNRNTDYKLLYILSSESMYQAYRRVKYIQQFNDQLFSKAEGIKKSQVVLTEKAKELETQQAQKVSIKKHNQKQKQSFLSDQNKQKSLVNELKKDEAQLQANLRVAENKKREISSAIRRAIEKELAAAIKPKTTTTGAKSTSFTLTPEAKLASQNFVNNKGKLPWPVERGVITSRFGKHAHEIVKTATVENNGIDISTTKSADMRAIFKGKVTSIMIIPGAGKVVMISHGAYRTVYSNLQEVYVQKGDEVSTKEKIGVLLPKGSISEAHFEIWKIASSGLTKQNPEYWIYRK